MPPAAMKDSEMTETDASSSSAATLRCAPAELASRCLEVEELAEGRDDPLPPPTGAEGHRTPSTRDCRRLCRKAGLLPEILWAPDRRVFDRFVRLHRDGTHFRSGAPFDVLAGLADPKLAIRCLRPGGKQALTEIRAGKHIEVRMALPPMLQNAQALVFERDDTGTVTLVSQHGLIAGDVRYATEVVVPRPLCHHDYVGPAGHLALTRPGPSELLILVADSPRLRLDHLPCFALSAPRDDAISVNATVDDDALTQIIARLGDLRATEWAIARKAIDIVA